MNIHRYNEKTSSIDRIDFTILGNKEIKNITGNSINLLNSNLESGLYFVKFTQSNLTIITYKLIITN